MTKTRLFARTAPLALIATLAAPAIAQDIAPAPAPVEPVPAPTASALPAPVIVRQTAPAPAQTTAAPSAATPAPSAPATSRIAPEALAQVEAEQAARNGERTAPARAERRAAAPTPVQAERAPTVTPTTEAQVATDPVPAAAPVAPSVTDTAVPPTETAPPAADVSSTNAGADWTPWVVGVAGIGLALALLAWAASRRRRVTDGPVAARQTEEWIEPVPVARPTLARDERPAAAPAAMPLAAAAAPLHMPVRDGAGRHERAALAGPSADNPFLTRRARLKRARFYDQREREALIGGREAAIEPRPVAAPMAKPQVQPQREPARPRPASPIGWPGGFKPAYGQG